MKNIWIFNHYATKMYFNKAGRHFSFAKYLLRAGYKVRIFCASTIHNSEENLITGSEVYREEVCDGISFTFIKARDYTGNGKQRILNILDYYRGLFKVTKYYDKPDVIIGSSVHPLACVAAIKLGNNYKCRKIAEIRDLWPESIVAYGVRSQNDLLVKLLYRLEKWIYTKADAIIFTMEGGRDYIIEKGWDTEHGGSVNLNKVHHINNGVDLELFDYNREHYGFADSDLDDPDIFKAVYTGSVRKVNNIGFLVEVAQELIKAGKNKIRLLIYGDGDESEALKAKSDELKLDNIVFKGKIDKKYIPYVLSKCDLCLMYGQRSAISQYGMSLNKSFDYLASGKPILSNYPSKYDYVEKNGCGISKEIVNTDEYATKIILLAELSEQEYEKCCSNSAKVASQFDFNVLTDNLCSIFSGV